MSRTIKGSKGPGYEYWGRRASEAKVKYADPGRATKSLTSRRMRRINKQTLSSQAGE